MMMEAYLLNGGDKMDCTKIGGDADANGAEGAGAAKGAEGAEGANAANTASAASPTGDQDKDANASPAKGASTSSNPDADADAKTSPDANTPKTPNANGTASGKADPSSPSSSPKSPDSDAADKADAADENGKGKDANTDASGLPIVPAADLKAALVSLNKIMKGLTPLGAFWIMNKCKSQMHPKDTIDVPDRLQVVAALNTVYRYREAGVVFSSNEFLNGIQTMLRGPEKDLN
mmetsp:Transcript_13123/g.28343  ORF Transcript_13123/g.28343 Transcript_13123/m.28343 type:complete len:234 (+) Transcript_13123:5473-6174(+)